MTGLAGLSLGSSLLAPIIGGLALAGASAASTHFLDSQYYNNKIKDLQLASANSVAAGYKGTLDLFIADTNQIHDAATRFQLQQVNLQAQFSSIKEAFSNAAKAKALPASCIPDAERLRILAAAISAANSASAASSPRPGAGKSLPKPGSPTNKHL